MGRVRSTVLASQPHLDGFITTFSPPFSEITRDWIVRLFYIRFLRSPVGVCEDVRIMIVSRNFVESFLHTVMIFKEVRKVYLDKVFVSQDTVKFYNYVK